MDVAVLGECAGDRETFNWVDADAGSELGEDVSIPLDDSYYQRLLDNRLPNIVHDAQATSPVRDLDVTREMGIGAWVGVPVTLPDGRLYGTLCCISAEARPLLSDRDVRCLRELAPRHVRRARPAGAQGACTENTSIRALVAALGARDRNTLSHSDVVVNLADEWLRSSASARTSATRSARSRSCTTSARWASPITSCTSPGRSTTPSG